MDTIMFTTAKIIIGTQKIEINFPLKFIIDRSYKLKKLYEETKETVFYIRKNDTLTDKEINGLSLFLSYLIESEKEGVEHMEAFKWQLAFGINQSDECFIALI